MSQDHEKYRLPLKKFPRLLDLKIRGRLMKMKIKRWFVQLNDAFSVKKLVASGLTLSIVAACGAIGARFHAYNGAVVPGDYFYDLRRDIEISYFEEAATEQERVEQLFDLSQRRLKEAELLLDPSATVFQLVPQAFAQDLDAEEDSQVSELIIEATNYEALALEEMALIEDLEVLEDLSEKADSFQQQRDNVLEMLDIKITREKDRKTFQRVSSAMMQHREHFAELRRDLKDAREQNLEGIPFDPRPIEIPMKKKMKMKKHFDEVRSFVDMKRVKRFADENLPPAEVQVLENHIKQLFRQGRNEDAMQHLRDFKDRVKHEERVQRFRDTKKELFRRKVEKLEDVIPPAKREEFIRRIERGDQDEVRREIQELRLKRERELNPAPETVFDLVKMYVEKVDQGELNLDGLPRIRELIQIAPLEEKRRIREYLQENLGFDPGILEPPVRPQSR